VLQIAPCRLAATKKSFVSVLAIDSLQNLAGRGILKFFEVPLSVVTAVTANTCSRVRCVYGKKKKIGRIVWVELQMGKRFNNAAVALATVKWTKSLL
jgi:hypothetical protein